MSMIVPKTNVTKSYLKISNLTLDDEALYKCEVTYLAVNRECNNVQHITLNITGNAIHSHFFAYSCFAGKRTNVFSSENGIYSESFSRVASSGAAQILSRVYSRLLWPGDRKKKKDFTKPAFP